MVGLVITCASIFCITDSGALEIASCVPAHRARSPLIAQGEYAQTESCKSGNQRGSRAAESHRVASQEDCRTTGGGNGIQLAAFKDLGGTSAEHVAEVILRLLR